MFRLKNPFSFAALRFSAAIALLVVSCGAHAADTLTVAATGTVMPMLKILIVTEKAPIAVSEPRHPATVRASAVRNSPST